MNIYARIINKLYSFILSKKLRSCGKSYFFSDVDILNPSQVSVGDNCLCYKGVWLAVQITGREKGSIHLSNSVVLSKGVIISSAYQIKIGEGVTIGPYSMIMDNNHGMKDLDKSVMDQGLIGYPIEIGDFAWVGGHVTVLPGVKIGKGVIVGAGSVVTKSIPDYKVAVGNPARVIGDRRDKKDD